VASCCCTIHLQLPAQGLGAAQSFERLVLVDDIAGVLDDDMSGCILDGQAKRVACRLVFHGSKRKLLYSGQHGHSTTNSPVGKFQLEARAHTTGAMTAGERLILSWIRVGRPVAA
jgi:hypothetical protein